MASVIWTGALSVTAVPAGAATQIGETFAPSLMFNCAADTTFLQTTSPGSQYAAPSPGVITSWSFQAASPAGNVAPLKFKVGRSAGGSEFTIVGESGVELPTPGVLNTFLVRIPVQAGDVIGFVQVGSSSGRCVRTAAGYAYHYRFEDVPPGGGPLTYSSEGDTQLDVSATLEADADNDGFGDETQDRCPAAPGLDGCPPNAFSFGRVKKHKQKGTATLTVKVPGPGTLVMTGKGLVRQRAGGASGAAKMAAEIVDAAGKVKLKVRSKGNKKLKLNRTGKVMVKPKLTYTPTGGEPSTKAKQIRLVKRL